MLQILRVNNSFVIIMQFLICYESKMHDEIEGIYTVGTKLGKIFFEDSILTKNFLDLPAPRIIFNGW